MATLCFDLEGTLIDALPGIRTCLAQVLEPAGHTLPGDEAIAAHLGHGFEGLLGALPGLEPAQVRRLLQAFHQRLIEEGIYRQPVLDGVPLMLDRLKRQGHRLILLSAQPGPVARALAYHLDLHLTFEHVEGYAPEAPWPGRTVQVLALRGEGILGPEGILIGDRAVDLQAAQALGYLGVAVAFGHGTRQELSEARADVILDTMEALDNWLQANADAPRMRDPFSHAE